MAINSKRSPGTRTLPWLRIVVAAAVAASGLDIRVLPAGITRETRLPPSCWPFVAEWLRRQRLTGRPESGRTARGRLPRHGLRGWVIRPWTHSETVPLHRWARRSRDRMRRVEAAGLLERVL